MKKVVIIILAVVLALGVLLTGILWWLGGQNDSSELVVKKIDRPDTDQDGLADWEEDLWQTDKEQADTDSDGTNDGAEIAAGRDPRRGGTSDQLLNPKERLEALVRNAFEREDKPLGTPNGPLPALLVYTRNDLTIQADETAASLTNYEQSLGAILKRFAATAPGDETPLLLRYLEIGDESALAELQAAGQDYFNLVQDLATTAVPASAANLHLELLNRAAYLTQLLFLMAEVKNQPLVAARSAQDLPLKLMEFLSFVKNFDPYFAERGIQ